MKVFQFTNDPDQYYIGTVKKQLNDWLVVQSIDKNGFLGGLEVLDSRYFKTIKKAKEIDFYKTVIKKLISKDIFHLKDFNNQFLQKDFQDILGILNYFNKNDLFTTLTLSNGIEISGKVIRVDSNQIIFKKQDMSFELAVLPVVINIDSIIEIAVNDEAHNVFANWLDNEQVPDSGIYAFYPMYSGDDRFIDYLAGKILAENDDYFLVQAVDDIGQLSAITVINKDLIAHVSEENAELDYLNFAVNEQKKNNTFDTLHLTENVDFSVIDAKSLKQMILNYSNNQLLSVDDVNFDDQDLGYLSKKDENSFTMQVVDDFSINRSMKFKYDDIVSIDLTSFDIESMSLFLRNERN